MQQVAHRHFCRSHDAYLGGVCAGIAESYEFDPIVIRILAVLLALVTFGLAAVVYIVLWLRWPLKSDTAAPVEVLPEFAESSSFGLMDCASGIVGPPDIGSADRGVSIFARLATALGLMLLFIGVSMNVAPLLSDTHWWQLWPLAFLIAGLCFIVIPFGRRYEVAWHALGIALTSISAMLMPMSLGVISWHTIPTALMHLWPFLLAAVVLVAIGVYRKVDGLIIVAAFCIVAFCLLALSVYPLPGDREALILLMPNGKTIFIGLNY